MTDHRPPPARDGHLDDEATLDALDSALGADGRAHLEACATCRAEVAAHAAVRDALAVPPPAVDPAVREAALAAAVDAWAPAAGDGAPTTAVHADELGARRRRRRPAPTAGWLGAAAVVLLLVVALPLLALAGGGGNGDDQSTAAGGDAAAGTDATEESATGLAAPAPVDVGDLGTIAPGEDLRPVVDRALGRADADDEVAALDAPEAGSGPADGAAPAEEAAGGPCVEEVREEMTDLGTLVLVGASTVEGEPARVLGFEAPTSARPAVVVVVVAEAGCDVVTFQSHAQR